MLLSELCYRHCEGAKAVLVVIVWKGVYFLSCFQKRDLKGAEKQIS